jgi:(R,R)-butanediol dehydrogenase/meso-butanediol dehydrogenase/diacetyl reductase
MKAMVWRNKTGLGIEDIDKPQASPGRVLIKAAACGICGSDLFLYKNRVISQGCILGHEVAGIVETVGQGVTAIAPGDRVLVRPNGCGICKHCVRGDENICSQRRSIGFGAVPGGFAEYLTVEPDQCIIVPAALGLDQAALTDQVSTALHALKLVRFQAGESALVLGSGPIGLCVIMMLKQAGASKIGVTEMLPERKALAEQFGAHAVFDPTQPKLAAAMAELYGPDGADAFFECSGAAPATQQAIAMAPRGARIALVGMCSASISIIPMSLFQRQLTIVGSFGNTQQECIECMDLMANKQIPSKELITKRLTLDDVPAEFEHQLTSKTDIKVQTQMFKE